MSFANHNILDIALSIIPPTVVQVRKNLGTKVNKYGQAEASYTDWIEVYGIVQPGSEQNEHTERIDFAKKTVTIWLRGYSLDGTHLQWAPDQIRYIGRIFNVTNVIDWFPYDNYRQCECVEALNLGPSQRGVPSAQSVQPRRRKVAPKSKSGEPVDNLQPTFDFGKPQEEKSHETEQMAIPPTESPNGAEGAEEPTPQPAPVKRISLVGKARIRF